MKSIPTVVTSEVTVYREDEYGDEIRCNVAVSGSVWEEADVIHVKLLSAYDDLGGRFVTSVEDLSWHARTWCEDSLAEAWEELNGG